MMRRLGYLTEVVLFVETCWREGWKNVGYARDDLRAFMHGFGQVLALHVAPKRLVRRWTRYDHDHD